MSEVPEDYLEALKWQLAQEIAEQYPLKWYEKLYGRIVLFLRRFTTPNQD